MANSNWTFRRCAAWVVGFWVVALCYPVSLMFGDPEPQGRFRLFCDRLGAVMYGDK